MFIIRLSLNEVANKKAITKREGPDGRCFHAAWAVSKSVH